MNTQIATTIFLIVICHLLKAQCPPSGSSLEFSTQEELNLFYIDYPDCEELATSIHIYLTGEENEITNLLPLQNLIRISDTLYLDQTSSSSNFINLEGLKNIKSAGILVLKNLNRIKNLSDFEELTEVEEIYVFGLDSLTQFSFPQNVQVNTHYAIDSNLKLVSLEGLVTLNELIYLSIRVNPSLRNLSPLLTLQNVHTIDISHVQDLSFLSNLEYVNELSILGNQELKDLDDLIALGNGDMVNANKLQLHNLSELEDLSAFDKLVYDPMLDLQLFSCGISNLNGLNIINTHDYTDVNISSNPNLTSLENLSPVTNLNSIKLAFNDNLASLTGLENLQTTRFLKIAGLPSLRNLNGLDALVSVSLLDIERNNNLETFDGLESLETIGAYINIYRNEKLQHIDALQNVSKTIPWTTLDLVIFNNSNLQSISGLSNLTAIFNSANISANNLLSVCNIPFVCTLAIQDQIIIESNNEGCFDIEQVVESCMLSDTDNLEQNTFKIYPNPTNGQFKLSNLQEDKVPYFVYNQNAQLIAQGKTYNGIIDIVKIEEGIYFLKIHNQVEKLFITNN